MKTDTHAALGWYSMS